MHIQAPAKTNPYLAVNKRRPDGYHDIVSLFVHLHDLYDSLTITPSPGLGLSISCDNPVIPCNEKNLVWQAAERISRELHINPDWHIDLSKRIPVAAGLGGGSSDAAAILKAIPKLCDRPVKTSRLTEIATGLGADVPFFLQDQPCVATGIGEILEPVRAGGEIPILLINTGFPISTVWAYNVQPAPGPPIKPLLDAFCSGDFRKLAYNTFNSFEDAVYRKFPILELVKTVAVKNNALTVRFIR